MTTGSLATDRLLLRRWTDADREPFAIMNADPVVMEHFVAPLSRAESDAAVDRYERHFDEHGFGLWVLQRHDDDTFLGFTGLNPMPPGTPGHGSYEVGWRLARSAWGHGYASEAARAALQVVWAAGQREVWSMTALTNVRSQAVMRRIGLQRWGEFDHPRVPVDSPLHRHVAYRLARPS